MGHNDVERSRRDPPALEKASAAKGMARAIVAEFSFSRQADLTWNEVEARIEEWQRFRTEISANIKRIEKIDQFLGKYKIANIGITYIPETITSSSESLGFIRIGSPVAATPTKALLQVKWVNKPQKVIPASRLTLGQAFDVWKTAQDWLDRGLAAAEVARAFFPEVDEQGHLTDPDAMSNLEAAKAMVELAGSYTGPIGDAVFNNYYAKGIQAAIELVNKLKDEFILNRADKLINQTEHVMNYPGPFLPGDKTQPLSALWFDKHSPEFHTMWQGIQNRAKN